MIRYNADFHNANLPNAHRRYLQVYTFPGWYMVWLILFQFILLCWLGQWNLYTSNINSNQSPEVNSWIHSTGEQKMDLYFFFYILVLICLTFNSHSKIFCNKYDKSMLESFYYDLIFKKHKIVKTWEPTESHLTEVHTTGVFCTSIGRMLFQGIVKW